MIVMLSGMIIMISRMIIMLSGRIIMFSGMIIMLSGVPLAFSFAQLAKGKSLGRSKPATNSQIQALQHTVWIIFTISKPYWTAFYRNKMSTTRCEWVRLFISRQSSLHIVAWERCWEITAVLRVLMIGLNDVKSYNTAKGFVNKHMCSLL